MNILLDYVFPITVVAPTPQASTAFLKQLCIVCKPKGGQTAGTIAACTTMQQVAALTDNTEAQQAFNAGMQKVYILLSDDLDLGAFLDAHQQLFFTVLISSDFVDGDLTDGTATPAVAATKKVVDMLFAAKTAGAAGNGITIAYVNDGTAGAETVGVSSLAITVHMQAGTSNLAQIYTALNASTAAKALVTFTKDVGDDARTQTAVSAVNLVGGADAIASDQGLTLNTFKGVVGFSSSDKDVCRVFAAKDNQAAFFRKDENGAKNMVFAFGSLLANLVNWLNQQFIPMPFSDGVTVLGDANTMFDDKVSFVIDDDQFGSRLGLFAEGQQAIAAPYILKNLRIDLQSAALQWIAANDPDYTVAEAALLESRLQTDVLNAYIQRKQIESGNIVISLEQQNFVATGQINVPIPKALWRVFAQMNESV